MYQLFIILATFTRELLTTAKDLYTWFFIDKVTIGAFLNNVIPFDLSILQGVLDIIVPWSFYDICLVSLPIYIGLCVLVFMRNLLKI